jgi:dihydroxyacetone kinase
MIINYIFLDNLTFLPYHIKRNNKEQVMKKIINQSEDIISEMMSGYLAAYSRYYEQISDLSAFCYKGRRKGKVALVIGGGSGHEPLFSGFVGKGLADAAACGNIFASPNPILIEKTAQAVDTGKGVLFLYGNYAGDNLNFDMAEELCRYDGIQTNHVRIWDDCASAPKERITDRRGIAGDVYVIKIAGAACDAGLSLEGVTKITEKARDNISSIGLATSPGTIPGMETAPFELGDDEIEFGMGLHGEPGIERTAMKPCKELVGRMYGLLKDEMALKNNDEVAVLVNSLGQTSLLELDIVYHDLYRLLASDSIIVHDAEIKKYCTCQEMGGFSITILRLDKELKSYYDKPCHSPFYCREQIE